jgi:hypothetical protein
MHIKRKFRGTSTETKPTTGLSVGDEWVETDTGAAYVWDGSSWKTSAVSAADVWSYSDRTLTQAKFPFWSAIITRTAGAVSVASATYTYVTIQPPAGETWWINLSGTISAGSGYYLEVGFIDNAGVMHQDRWRYPTASPGYGHYNHFEYAQLPIIITNTAYIRISFYQNTGSAVSAWYSYSGFKLSHPLWSPSRLYDPEPKPFKLPTTLPLPDPLKPLDKHKAMILGLDPEKPNEYALGIILEEDTPLAVDPATGFPVERLSVYVKADVLADFILKFKRGEADPVQTGYAKYLKRWKSEGIDFGIPSI